MTFWQRLFFPKTAQLEDYAASLRQKDAMIQSLIDAVVKGRGELPVFEQSKAVSSKGVKTLNPYTAEQTAWFQNSTLIEDDRIVADAVADEEEYADLYLAAQNGQQGAKELLQEVDRRLAMQVLAEERLLNEGAIQ